MVGWVGAREVRKMNESLHEKRIRSQALIDSYQRTVANLELKLCRTMRERQEFEARLSRANYRLSMHGEEPC